ncbi:zymogen granule protein 16 homolog B-like [Myotis myotis]|uniref:Zymogen granule protein 16B n=1 Tax=Myotis myotis TaxID=51298 RepID=A0A7J7Y3F9_MYOMY|nr:zymogen granule protein 16 homolog B-like [Myotis myotis]KAF6356439.1 zymogen granule protein 16B [Myotis myotis]
MLLWLTLTILWSTTCWADQMYGNGGGTYFSSSIDNKNDISGIRVSISPIGIFRSIQLKYGSAWSQIYGVSGGSAQEFILQPDEYIIGLVGSHRVYLRYLVVYTNLGRWAPFGQVSGRSFTVYPDEPGMVLTGLFGQTQLLGITGIGFKWDYPLAEPESIQQSTN